MSSPPQVFNHACLSISTIIFPLKQGIYPMKRSDFYQT